MTRTQADMADNREATAAECLLHEHVHLFTELLRRHVPAFRNASLLATATQTGVRETRRIRGFHTLTGEEYLHAVDFPDAVSRGCHPVDIHAASSTGQRCEFLKEAAFIPYRCLIAPRFPEPAGSRPVVFRLMRSRRHRCACRLRSWGWGRRPEPRRRSASARASA